MCGILVFFDCPQSEERMKEALTLLAHRGPDDAGTTSLPGGMMGMRRLSILDLKGGKQPLSDEQGNLQLVFNGEIVNYLELRRALSPRHSFATGSDAEVIVHGFEEEGIAFFEKLEGMYAFALYDFREDLLLLTRDPFGIKPLYYMEEPFFAASSEIKPLLFLRQEKPSLNLSSLHRHLTFGYDPTEATCFSRVKRLRPGEILERRPGRISKRERVWSIAPWEPKEAEAKALVDKTLKESIVQHLLSDVPVGAFLSGGLDSSLVAALALREHPSLHTFSIGFPGFGIYDETSYAHLAAMRIGSYHHTFRDRLPYEELPKMLLALEEPVADASFIPFYALCARVASSVKVVLSGLGGDELFFGYYRYLPLLFPRFAGLKPASHLVAKLSFRSETSLGDAIRLLKKWYAGSSGLSPLGQYLSYNAFLNRGEKKRLYGEKLRPYISQDPAAFLDHLSFPPACQDKVGPWADLHCYLPGDTLFLTDKISMAHSLEVRVPFLHRKLARLAFSLPTALHFRHFTKKYLLKRVAEQHLPLKIVHRRKHGFSPPLEHWLFGRGMRYLRQAFSPERVRALSLFSYQRIWEMVDLHLSRRVDYSQPLFQLFLFDLFHRLFFDHSFLSYRGETLDEIY